MLKVTCFILLYFSANGKPAEVEIGKFETRAACEAHGDSVIKKVDLWNVDHAKVVCK